MSTWHRKRQQLPEFNSIGWVSLCGDLEKNERDSSAVVTWGCVISFAAKVGVFFDITTEQGMSTTFRNVSFVLSSWISRKKKINSSIELIFIFKKK